MRYSVSCPEKMRIGRGLGAHQFSTSAPVVAVAGGPGRDISQTCYQPVLAADVLVVPVDVGGSAVGFHLADVRMFGNIDVAVASRARSVVVVAGGHETASAAHRMLSAPFVVVGLKETANEAAVIAAAAVVCSDTMVQHHRPPVCAPLEYQVGLKKVGSEAAVIAVAVVCSGTTQCRYTPYVAEVVVEG